MESEAKAGVITRVHEIYIKAPQEQIWEAITAPEWTAKYGYRAPIAVELRLLSDLKSLLETGSSMSG